MGERYPRLEPHVLVALTIIHVSVNREPPGRDVGAEAAEDSGEPFADKMQRLVSLWREQSSRAAELDAAIRTNMEALGYGR